jgi:hypothetical protein
MYKMYKIVSYFITCKQNIIFLFGICGEMKIEGERLLTTKLKHFSFVILDFFISHGRGRRVGLLNPLCILNP